MRVSIKNGTIPPKTIFKLVTVGFSVASLVLFLPFFLVVIVLLSGRSPNTDTMGIAISVLVLPVVLVAQAALIAALVNFGLYIYRRFRSVTYERE